MEKIQFFYSSPVQYEKTTVEIQIGMERIAELNREHGVYRVEVELFGTDATRGFIARLPLDDLIDALLHAKELLKKEELREK